MKKKKYIYGFILCLTLTSITACSPKKESSNTSNSQNQESNIDENQSEEADIMAEFNKLIGSDASLKDIATFMSENVANVTKEEVSEMILKLEDLHSNQREKEDEKYLPEEIQKGFNVIGAKGIDVNQVDTIKDETIKKLVTESKDNGYKVETAEGYFFPVIDYSFYKQFSSYGTPEIKDYIDIMTVESDKIFAKDAALMISWEEVVNRTLSVEKFLSNYPDSKKSEYMKSLYDNYVFITMHGLNNTPLFDYELKKMDEDAKNAYSATLVQSIDSKYLKNLGEFMTVAKKSNYMLTDEVEDFRKANTDNGSSASKDPNRYEVGGIVDADEFDQTFELIRAALSNNDKDTFADYIAYPIKVTLDGKKIEIKDKSEFIKNFDKIINDDLKNIFMNQKVEEFFVNQYGIMVGDGEFWLNQIQGTKHKFSIYAINN